MRIEIETPARRGNFLAYVEGPDPRFGVALDFSNGVYVKTRRAFKHTIDRPCFVAIGGWSHDRGGKWRDYYMVTEVGTEKLPAGIDIARVTAGPRPGEPGSYGDGRCECGKPVASYDADGMPTCDACTPAPADESLPNPVTS